MESKWIYSFTFDIKDEFNIINITNTTCEDCQDEGNSNLDSSSISINQNKNEILICYKYNDKKNSHCYFYNIDNNSFNKNYTITDCKRYITASYFIETQEFIVICNPEGKEVNLYEINANNKEQKLYFVENATDFGCNFLKFFLSYNSIKNEYNLINDCYKNHTYIYLLNISVLNIIDNPTEREKDANIITNSSDKATTNLIEYNIIYISEKKTIDEILSNLTDFLKDKKIG